MKKLNFYPYYKALLESEQKTTTLRLQNREKTFQPGEQVMLTVGWRETETPEEIHPAVIEKVYEKRISELEPYDFEGESPDCITIQAVPFVLSAIYRTIVNAGDVVTVIKFKHVRPLKETGGTRFS